MSEPKLRRFKTTKNCYIDDIYRHADLEDQNDFTTSYFSGKRLNKVPAYLIELDLVSGKPLEDDEKDETNPEKMTVAELRKYAKSLGLKSVDSSRKDEILEKINLLESDSGEGAGLVKDSDSASNENVA